MQLVCPCLNVTINVVAEEESFQDSSINLDIIKRQYGEEVAGDAFFALCERGDVSQFLLLSENGIVEKLPVLMRKRSVDNKWDVRRCLLCGIDAYAIRSNCTGNQILVNTKLFLRHSAAVEELRKSPEISPVFQVILPKKEKIQTSTETSTYFCENGNGYSNGASMNMVSRSVLQSVQTCISQYLTRQQQLMEDRIRDYVEKEQSEFDRLREQAKAQKTDLLRFLAKGDGGGSSGEMLGSTMDDDYDSALPLSPLSFTSGDPSPGLTTTAMNFVGAAGDAVFVDHNGTSVVNHTLPLRPKSLSNPVSLNGYKRKRHSGNGGVAPSLTSHDEEHQDIFCFDEQEDGVNDVGVVTVDDEGNITDDSGTCEDYSKYYPPLNPTTNVKSTRNNKGPTSCYGKSLPVCAPAVAAYRPNNTNAVHKFGNFILKNEMIGGGRERMVEKAKDVGASMQALALTMQGADDPERLFGERPQRRRWKTGEERQQLFRQRHHSTIDEGAIMVFMKDQH